MDPKAILDKIKKQDRSECAPELLSAMDAWEQEIARLEGLKAIAGHAAIKEMVKKYTEKITEIVRRLSTERKMPELDRENLLDRKELYTDFISTFDVDEAANLLAAEVDKHLD